MLYIGVEDEITKLDDSLLVKSERIDGPSLMPLVLSYGGFAKVVNPPEIIDDLVRHIEILKIFIKGDRACPNFVL